MSQRKEDVIYNIKMKESFEFAQIQTSEIGLLTSNSSININNNNNSNNNKCNYQSGPLTEGGSGSGNQFTSSMHSYSEVTKMGESSFGNWIPSNNQERNGPSHPLESVHMYHNPTVMLNPGVFYSRSSTVSLQQQYIYTNHSTNGSCYGGKSSRYIPYNRSSNFVGFNNRRQLISTERIYGKTTASQALVNPAPIGKKQPGTIMNSNGPLSGGSVCSAKNKNAPIGTVKVPALSSIEKKHNSFATHTSQRDSFSTTNSNNNNSKTAIKDVIKMTGSRASVNEVTNSESVTLQITNFDHTIDENSLRYFLLNQLKPITPVASIVFEGGFYVKVTVPDLYFAKQVVSNLHRKKVGHKRMLVSYFRNSSVTEMNTLRCQVAGLLKDVPSYTLPMYKFRELFQSRFKTSISILDLYKMQDICTINVDSNNDDKFITLHTDVINSFENLSLIEGKQHSTPYCALHFRREQHKGWAEQDIEPLPNVCMSIGEIQQILVNLLKSHTRDVPIASLVHCIQNQLNIQIVPNESGVNLEHLVCCVPGVQIRLNSFGIRILDYSETGQDNFYAAMISDKNNLYSRIPGVDPLNQISREVIELVKMSPKATMKFNRFIPAYHNHFGKQCRVADYGYTKLIELFKAIAPVVQIMGDGENRQITLTHRTQVRRFTSDLLRILRTYGNKSILLSQLPAIFAQTQNRNFDITDYGVCNISDILDGLVYSNIVVVSAVTNGNDLMLSIPKRRQSSTEMAKTAVFAGEVIELFRNAPQYSILFQKFVRSYHYHFGYQCRLSDYGFLKLTDLVDSIRGVIEVELNCDENKKIYLSIPVARRVFGEQCEELTREISGFNTTLMKLSDILKAHKKKYGYEIQPSSLGAHTMREALSCIPYVETIDRNGEIWIICHHKDQVFRQQCYKICRLLLNQSVSQQKPNGNLLEKSFKNIKDFLDEFNEKNEDQLRESQFFAMNHAVEIIFDNNGTCILRITNLMAFLLNVICLLEENGPTTILDLKTALGCNLQTTFEFGFANLYSMLQAYSDIFCLKAATTHDRCEVSLIANIEISKDLRQNYGSYLATLNEIKCKNKLLGRFNHSHSENYCRTLNQPKTFNQATTEVYSSNRSEDLSNKNTTEFPIAMGANEQYHQSLLPGVEQTYPSCGYSSIPVVDINGNILNSSHLSGHSMDKDNSSSTVFTSNNSLGSSWHNSSALADSQGHSNSSYGDHFMHFTLPISPVNMHGKNAAIMQEKELYPSESVFTSSETDSNEVFDYSMARGATPSESSCDLLSIQQLVDDRIQESDDDVPLTFTWEDAAEAEKSSSYFTKPPVDSVPCWMDPVWMNSASNDSMNESISDLDSLKILPTLLSPYSISKIKNKKRVLTFDM